MSKGILFTIPIILGFFVGLTIQGSYAPFWALGTLLVGMAIVFFYIRNQKHDNNEPGNKT